LKWCGVAELTRAKLTAICSKWYCSLPGNPTNKPQEQVAESPFSTTRPAEFIEYRSALLLYWDNIFLLGAMLPAGWICVRATTWCATTCRPRLSWRSGGAS
jgi:hypothetical protein